MRFRLIQKPQPAVRPRALLHQFGLQNDEIVQADSAGPYLRDLPAAELHLLDTGHFALEDKRNEIAALMRDFLSRKLPRK